MTEVDFGYRLRDNGVMNFETPQHTDGTPSSDALRPVAAQDALRPVASQDALRPVVMIGRQHILKSAGDLIDGDRAKDYGDAYVMHARIAAGWSQILGIDIAPHQVALCMSWLKISRLVESPDHADSYVDLVAYGALAGEIRSRDSAKAE